MDPDTHEAMVTGQRGSKFGPAVPDVVRAAAWLRPSRWLRLEGLCVHVGSQLLGTEPFVRAVPAVAAIGELGDGTRLRRRRHLRVRYTYTDRPRAASITGAYCLLLTHQQLQRRPPHPPPVVSRRDGEVDEAVHRETFEDLQCPDVPAY